MESGGIESAAAASSKDLLLLMQSSGGDSDSFDAVHLHKMKLLTENVITVDKVLAPQPVTETNNNQTASPPRPAMCNNIIGGGSGTGSHRGAPSTPEILQIVELSDLLQLSESSKKCLVQSSAVAPLIDLRVDEKCDVTPENLKKCDQDEEEHGFLIDLRGSSDGGLGGDMQFCDMTSGAAGREDSAAGVQLTLLDLDEPPAPEKAKAFTISFCDGERSEEQKQKYEKMFERFQNKRSHRRGQSMSRVDVELSKSASQDSQANPKPGGHNRLAKTPSSAKLPRKTFSEPSSKANEDQQQQHLDDDAKVKLRDKRNAAMREPSKRHSWSPRTTTVEAAVPVQAVDAADKIEPVAVKIPAELSRVDKEQLPMIDKNEPPQPPQPLQAAMNGKFTARSSVLAKVLVDTKPATRTVIDGGGRAAVSQVQFQPPPTPQRPQLPEAPLPLPKSIKQRGFVCEAQPLIDDSKEEVDDDLSDAGTYTLDGDNYTEEQKEMMDIDNLRRERQLMNKWEDLMAAQREEEELEEQLQREQEMTFLKCKRTPIQRPTSFEPSLEIIDLELIPTSPKELRALESDLHNDNDCYYTNKPRPDPARKPTRSNGRNVLDISCSYEEKPQPTKSVPATKQKVSYLEKIKTKVKNLSGSGKSVVNKSSEVGRRDELQSPDIGTFTSVTTSGILSYKATLEDKPSKFGRRNSLTKTQIQNTEYVQGVSRVVEVTPSPLADEEHNEKIMNSITDSDKLNLLSSSENDDGTSMATSTSSALKSAVTKNDWIHEWAKSARRSTSEMSRSFTVDSNVNRLRDDPMSRSECFAHQLQGEEGGEEEQEEEEHEYGVNLDRNTQKKQHLVKRGTNLNEANFVRGKGSADVDNPLAQLRYSVRRRYSGDRGQGVVINDAVSVSSSSVAAAANRRPPMSPTKIPSPVHTMRSRSVSNNHSVAGSAVDLVASPREASDTDVYLQNTAAAILTLQSMHLNNSLHNSPSPSHPPTSPRRTMVAANSPNHPRGSSAAAAQDGGGYNIIEECQNKMNRIQQLHKRNLSLDGSERDRNRARCGKNNANVLGRVQRADPQQHTRHHSYEGAHGLRQMGNGTRIDPTTADDDEEYYQQPTHVARQLQQSGLKGHGAPQSSPIRRSSSFTAKPGAGMNVTPNGLGGTGGGHAKVGRQTNAIKKSASSTSFKKYHYEDEGDIYINDDDDLDPGRISNESEYSCDLEGMQQQQQPSSAGKPITNTRCNKAFMMRMEQNKHKPMAAALTVGQSAPQTVMMQKQQGVVACPNTPELSRRGPLLMRQPLRDRQSMPRDSSLNRMKQDSQMNFSSAKKVLKEAPVKVQPKYLDISKYKPTTTGNFLKKDESKSYLVKGAGGAPGVAAAAGITTPTSGAVDCIKRSPSSASVTLTRTDPARMSNRSVKSAGMRPNQKKEPPAPAKQTKEQELAMWRRRASYDPMKAAMEGKKRQEEAKRQLMAQQSKLPESPMVLRSQSFHSGAMMMRHDGGGDLIDGDSNADSQTRWTTESSDEDF